jgi:colanic acid/amylovoran biosynthesis protein
VYIMALALWAGKPLYLLPQSIGPLRRRWERWLVGWLLARARLVMVRETLSLKQLPVPPQSPRVRLLPDTALTFTGAPLAEATAWLLSQGIDLVQRPYLGLTAINWYAQNPAFPSQTAYEQALALAIQRFVEVCQGRAVFFPQVCGPSRDQDDRVAARRVAALLPGLGDRLVLIETTPEPALLKTAMGQMDVFLGTRMHSNLFALSGAVPFLAIAYQFKTQGIVRMVGLEQWVLPIEQASGGQVAEQLLALWQAREPVRAHLEAVVPPLKQQAAQAGPLVAADFAQWRASR